jgi:hypothetical protein
MRAHGTRTITTPLFRARQDSPQFPLRLYNVGQFPLLPHRRREFSKDPVTFTSGRRGRASFYGGRWVTPRDG